MRRPASLAARATLLGSLLVSSALVVAPAAQADPAPATAISPQDPRASSATSTAAPDLSAIDCPSTDRCVAAGSKRNESSGLIRVIAFDPAKPSDQTLVPNLELRGLVQAISCSSPERCLIVGAASKRQGSRPAAWILDHGVLSDAGLPKAGFTGPAFDRFTSVSCPTDRWCAATGDSLRFSGRSLLSGPAVAEVLANGAWTPVSAPSGFEYASINAVSCAAEADCSVVGISADAGSVIATAPGGFVGSLNSSGWSVSESGGSTTWESESCPSSDRCLISGFDRRNTNAPTLRWAGGGPLDLPLPSSSGLGSFISAVDCPSTQLCAAVGGALSLSDGGPFPGRLQPLAWSIAGGSVQRIPLHLRGFDGMLGTMSCTTAGLCTAIEHRPRGRSALVGFTAG